MPLNRVLGKEFEKMTGLIAACITLPMNKMAEANLMDDPFWYPHQSNLDAAKDKNFYGKTEKEWVIKSMANHAVTRLSDWYRETKGLTLNMSVLYEGKVEVYAVTYSCGSTFRVPNVFSVKPVTDVGHKPEFLEMAAKAMFLKLQTFQLIQSLNSCLLYANRSSNEGEVELVTKPMRVLADLL
jgi:hypothetical protein